MRAPSVMSPETTDNVERFMGTAYDKVRIVHDNIDSVVAVANNLGMLTELHSVFGSAANVLDRANHTGEQSIATITGLSVILDTKYGPASEIPWTQLTGVPVFFDGTWESLSGKPVLFDGSYAALTGKPALFDGTWASLSGKPVLFDGTYASLTGTPATFPPEAHTQAIGTVTGLQAALDAKQGSLGYTAENQAQKGIANGYASLDSAGLVPLAQLPKAITVNTKTASHELVLADAGTYVRMNVATANNLTVPPDATVAFPVGTVIQLRQAGAGQTTVVAGSGVTVSTSETLKLRKQGASAALIKVGANSWDLTGDLEAV